MNGKLKKQALRALFSNRAAAVRIFFTYAFEIGLLLFSDYFFLDYIAFKLMFFCMLFILSAGEYNVFMKLAEHKDISEDDFSLIFTDRDYINHFKSDGKNRYYTMAQAAVFLILCRILILLLPDIFIGKSLGGFCFCLFLLLISLIIFVLYLTEHIFVPYIIADRYNTKTIGKAASSDEIFALNKRLVEYDRFKIIKFILSFSGWFVLSVLTFGIGFIFLIPYFNQATAMLYVEKREQYNYIYEMD